jgi:hypothetical protein
VVVINLPSSINKSTQLSQTVQRFWRFLAGYILAAIGVSLLHAVLFGGWVGLLAAGTAALLLMVILTIAQPWFVPFQVSQWQVEPVTILGDWPPHDLGQLAQLTAALAELGFMPLQDYAQPQRTGKFQPIARCFGNPHLGAFAEIGFCLLNPGADDRDAAVVVELPQPLITHLVFLSRFEQGWMLIDGNFAPHRRESLIYAWRNPREVRHYYPDLSLATLADRHLGNRQAMQRRLAIQAEVGDVAWDSYRELQQELITQPWRRLRRRNLLVAMLDATRFERQPAHEWLGEYRQALRQDLRPDRQSIP